MKRLELPHDNATFDIDVFAIATGEKRQDNGVNQIKDLHRIQYNTTQIPPLWEGSPLRSSVGVVVDNAIGVGEENQLNSNAESAAGDCVDAHVFFRPQLPAAAASSVTRALTAASSSTRVACCSLAKATAWAICIALMGATIF